MQRELGPTHIDADIGCHSFTTFAPFSLGNSHSRLRHHLAHGHRGDTNMEAPIAIIGDGRCRPDHRRPNTSKGDGVLIVMQNGYASATGQQYIPSSAASKEGGARNGHRADFTCAGRKMAAHRAPYSVSTMVKTLKRR